MSWMKVEVESEGQLPVKNIVNIDTIVLVGPKQPSGSYIRLTDGSSIHVTDSFEEIEQVVLQAQSK